MSIWVAMIPVGVEELTRAGHQVLIQAGAGQGSGISDDQYAVHGAEIAATPEEIWKRQDLIVKVKEPLPAEWPLMRPGQLVFTYFHFAADESLTHAVMQSGITAIAYETIQDAHGNLPLLTPMSEVAGRMSIQEGAKYLERPFEGRGILLGGVPGVLPANVVILGGGIVGANAAKVAAGLARTSPSSISSWIVSRISMMSCRATSLPCSAIAIISWTAWTEPTSSSVPCSFQGAGSLPGAARRSATHAAWGGDYRCGD